MRDDNCTEELRKAGMQAVVAYFRECVPSPTTVVAPAEV